jgi:hypothetical protein
MVAPGVSFEQRKAVIGAAIGVGDPAIVIDLGAFAPSRRIRRSG